MKKPWFFILLFIMGCVNTDTKNQLQKLSGYWEIEKVVLPDGKTREYTINQTVDYFELKPDSTGFRKKLQPQLNGRFLATDHIENFEIKKEEDQLHIYYKTTQDQWQEIILNIDENRLVIKNNDNLTYFYKRFKAIDITP